MTDELARYEKLLRLPGTTIRDLDIDAFADGVIAHRAGVPFHGNPDRDAMTVRRLSWAFGWNERAIQHG